MERQQQATGEGYGGEQRETTLAGWRALADEVVARRVALGFRLRSEFAEATGLAIRTLGDIENARRVRYDKRTIAAIENALNWPSGMVSRIVAGGAPMIGSVQRRVYAMDLLYDHVSEGASSIPHFVDLLDSEPDEQAQGMWRVTLRSLRDQGLINLSETMGFGGTAAWLTDAGRAEVEERRARRSDPVLRKSTAANALLRWLYELNAYGDTFQQIAPIENTDRAVLEGERLPVDLFFAAAERLVKLGLLEGGVYVAEINGPLTAKLTEEGQEIVESGRTVEDFVRGRKQQQQPAHVTHFHGPVSGNVSWASSHITQTVKTTQSGIAGEELNALVQAIAEAVPVLGLAEEDAADVSQNARVIQGELARAEPDQHIVKTYLARTLDTVVGAGNSTLGLVLAGYAKELMKAIGVPLE